MKSFNPKCFSSIAALRSISSQLLRDFLRPHRRYFLSRGIVLPSGQIADEFDYGGLTNVLMNPDGETPDDLIDALHIVNEMCEPEANADLVDRARDRGIELPATEDLTAADIAIHIWLRDRQVVEQVHAELHIGAARTYEHFQSKGDRRRVLPRPTAQQMTRLEADLDEWFAHRKRGRGTRILVVKRADGTWFLIRHGDGLKREECLDAVGTRSVCFRPCKYDLVVYHPAAGELRVNCRTRGEKELYRRQFGKHFFGDEEHFPGEAKYTLEPIREMGEDCLACGHVPGIEWIRLCEYSILYPGAQWEKVTRRAEDIFARLRATEREFPAGGTLIKACFKVKFVSCKSPRSVTIRPSNVAQYTRDGDESLIEQWLLARGFIRPLEESPDEEEVPAMAGD